MRPLEGQRRLEEAAAPTRERLRRDAERVSPLRIRPLVEVIAARLFDPELSWAAVERLCGVRDHTRSTLFRRELGASPAAYLREARLEVAARLLADTPLRVHEVARLTAFSSATVFSLAFRRWAEMPPRAYRQAARRRAGVAGSEPAGAVSELTPSSWRRWFDGSLAPDEVRLHLRHLLQLYPDSRPDVLRELLGLFGRRSALDGESPLASDVVASLRSLIERGDLERLAAELIWEDLEERDFAAQQDLLRHRLGPFGRAVFLLLVEKSREAGRLDAQRGIQLARLALETAVAVEGAGDDDGQAVLSARGWAWLANAKRIAGDFAGAEQALVAAERRLPDLPRAPDERQAAAETLTIWAKARRDQRRLEEALALAERAVDTGRGATPATLARALVERALGRLEAAPVPPPRGTAEAVTRDLAEAQALAQEHGLRYESCLATYHVARQCLESGDLAAAQAHVRTARRLLLEPPATTAMVEPLDWLEARLALRRGDAAAAVERLRQIRDGYLSRGMAGQAAVAGLDLAQALMEGGRPGEAAELATELLPSLQAISGPQAMVAVGLLGRALDAGGASGRMVSEARSELLRALRSEGAAGDRSGSRERRARR